VKTTSKREALNWLFVWHGFSEVDSSMFSADESGRRARRRVHINDLIDRAMLRCAVVCS
jgi:hypothetical protein